MLARLRLLTCLDRRTVHPSERDYILRQEEEEAALLAGASQGPGKEEWRDLLEDVLPVVLHSIQDNRTRVHCAMVCRRWRDLSLVGVGEFQTVSYPHAE